MSSNWRGGFAKSLGAKPTLMVDVGYLFNDVPTAARICRELEELDIFFFETPFPVDSPEPYARLAESTSIPLAMGEHGVTRWEFLDMMDRGRCPVVQPYMTTCGGLTEAKRIVDLAVPRGRWSAPATGPRRFSARRRSIWRRIRRSRRSSNSRRRKCSIRRCGRNCRRPVSR